VVIEVYAEDEDAIGLKEDIIMRLEAVGKVRVLYCEPWKPQQMVFDEIGLRGDTRRMK
jgi:hypothetical protein